MKAFLALIKREFLEHRGAFFIAPLVVTGLLVLVTLLPWVSGRMEGDFVSNVGHGGKLYEFFYLGSAGLWWLYLMAALFFYHADAFAADKRNNAMLFWKSMPQSDFKILASKLVAGLTLLPFAIILVMALSGLWALVVVWLTSLALPFTPPTPLEAAGSYVQATLVCAVLTMVALLWYLPFMAFVGALSAVVGRWAIPLAFLIPALIGLVERLLVDGGPPMGYVGQFLRDRLQLDIGQSRFEQFLATPEPLNAGALIADALAHVSWPMMVGGWAFALVAIVLASQYRRRVLS